MPDTHGIECLIKFKIKFIPMTLNTKYIERKKITLFLGRCFSSRTSKSPENLINPMGSISINVTRCMDPNNRISSLQQENRSPRAGVSFHLPCFILIAPSRETFWRWWNCVCDIAANMVRWRGVSRWWNNGAY